MSSNFPLLDPLVHAFVPGSRSNESLKSDLVAHCQDILPVSSSAWGLLTCFSHIGRSPEASFSQLADLVKRRRTRFCLRAPTIYEHISSFTIAISFYERNESICPFFGCFGHVTCMYFVNCSINEYSLHDFFSPCQLTKRKGAVQRLKPADSLANKYFIRQRLYKKDNQRVASGEVPERVWIFHLEGFPLSFS
jgi:hypothetical protein